MVGAWIGRLLSWKGVDFERFVSDGIGREGEALRVPIADEGAGLHDAVLVHVAEFGRASVLAFRRVCR